MKLVEGTVFTKDMEKVVLALESTGLVVHEVNYDGRKMANFRLNKGIACLYNLFNRVKIRTVVNDELVGTLLETLRSFGECRFSIFNEGQICWA